MRYRADIDGLRAVAVLPVVLFHAGFAAFGGGYIGVDVFFVISGYLVTRIISREVREGRFSVLNFYERRIRRIFPALAAVVLFSWLASAYVLLPSAFKDFSQSVAAAALFVSNLLFWREAGYFSPAADSKPLLHTWSLSVEEQFYLLFPLLLVVLRARSKAFQRGTLAALAIASFVVSVSLVDDSPTAAFYFSGGRAWELLLGSLLALDALPRPRTRLPSDVLTAAGLGLILWSVFSYTRFTPFPGWGAVPPCLGAALILLAGESGDTWTGTALSFAPIVWIGKISYSLYLWHWPLLVAAKHWKVEALTRADLLLWLTVSAAAAGLSWKFVEQPFRRPSNAFSQKSVFALAGGVIAAGLSVGVFGQLTQGWPVRFSADVLELAAFRDPNPLPSVCPEDAPCSLGTPNVGPDLFIWGDSHARSITPAVEQIAERQGRAVKIYNRPGCVPIAGIAREPDTTNCGFAAENILEKLEREKPGGTVILAGRWSHVFEGESDRSKPPLEFRYTDRSKRRLDRAEQHRLVTEQLQSTIDRLLNRDRKVILVYPIPEQHGAVPETLVKRLRAGLSPADYYLPWEEYCRRHAAVIQDFDSLRNSERFIRVRPSRALCREGRCLSFLDGRPLYLDDQHLSVTGSLLLKPLFEAAMRSQK